MVREHKATTATQTLVLYALSAFADEQGKCWPSLRKLRLATGLGKSALCDALGALEDSGRISRQKGGPKVGSTSYRLVRQADNVVRETDKSSAPAGQAVVRQPDTKLPVEGPQKAPMKKQPVTPVALPDWLSPEIWNVYQEHRRLKRASKLTEYGVQLQIKHLAEWHDQGQDVKAIIEQSIANGWTGLFPLKSNGIPKPSGERKCADCGASSTQGVRLYKDLGRLRCFECVHKPVLVAQDQEADIPF